VLDFIGTTYFPPNIQYFNIMEYLHKSTDNLPLQSSSKTLHWRTNPRFTANTHRGQTSNNCSAPHLMFTLYFLPKYRKQYISTHYILTEKSPVNDTNHPCGIDNKCLVFHTPRNRNEMIV